jgi:methylated-DNA-[protein]-cysteine S-methyltransferase
MTMRDRWIIATNARGVTELRLAKQGGIESHRTDGHWQARRWRMAAEKELRAYFAGRLQTFVSCTDISRMPPFTQAVLKLTTQVPYGEVRSYGWVARAMGKPKAARAVGNALARNPVPILIPCHRIVRNDGKIGGFALGSRWKKKLLDLEKRAVASMQRRKRRAAT